MNEQELLPDSLPPNLLSSTAFNQRRLDLRARKNALNLDNFRIYDDRYTTMDSEEFLSIPNLEGRKVPSYSYVKSIFFNDLDLLASGRSTALYPCVGLLHGMQQRGPSKRLFVMKPKGSWEDVPRRSSPISRRGYTAVELVMGLLVGLVLTGMAIPQVQSGLYTYRLKGATASAIWAIQSTRYQSLMEGYPYQVVFSQANQTYHVQNLPPGSASYANVGTAVPLSGTPVTLNQDTTLQFKPNGSVTATVGALSFIITYQSRTATLTVSNYGNVSVVYN